MKTGDVKKFKRSDFCDYTSVIHTATWALILNAENNLGYRVIGYKSRSWARTWRMDGERIAKILSIGPKLVTVQVSK